MHIDIHVTFTLFLVTTVLFNASKCIRWRKKNVRTYFEMNKDCTWKAKEKEKKQELQKVVNM